MREKCNVPIRTRSGGDWLRCSRPPGHGPDGNGIDGHGLVDGRDHVYADAIDAPLFLGPGGRDPGRRELVERGTREPPEEATGPFAEYRKTATLYAAPIGERFTIETIEGVHEGQAGDYLAVGAAGELYPIAADILHATYEEIKR